MKSLKEQVVDDLTQLRYIIASTMGVIGPDHSSLRAEIVNFLVRIDHTREQVNRGGLKKSGLGTKCIVKGCENKVGEGNFVGELCSPCHEHLTTGRSYQSAAFRLAVDSAFEYMTNRVSNKT